MLTRETGGNLANDTLDRGGAAEIAILRALAPIAEEWRRFETTASGHVFQTFAFVSMWIETVGRERQIAPLIVVGRDAAQRTMFILPFGVRRRLWARQLEWLGGEHADYQAGLFDRGFLAREAERGSLFAEGVMALLASNADVCNLRRQPATIDGLPNPFAAYHALRHADSSHETRLGSSWDGYYREKRNSSSRRHDRSKLKGLEAIGSVRFRIAITSEEIDRAMDALFAEKERSLRALGAGGFFATEGVRRFYRELASRPYPAGPAHVATLECAGEIVAVNWGLLRGGRYYYVMHAFAAESPATKFSPGRALMHLLMQWCIAEGIEVFDFTIGDEDFKEQWCEATLPLSDSVVALAAAGAPFALVLRTGKAAKRIIKGNRTLRGLAGEVRRRLPIARSRPVASGAG